MKTSFDAQRVKTSFDDNDGTLGKSYRPKPVSKIQSKFAPQSSPRFKDHATSEAKDISVILSATIDFKPKESQEEIKIVEETKAVEKSPQLIKEDD